MLTAITKDGSVISTQDVRMNKIKEFYCPECKESVIMKNGIYKKSHFAHKPNSECFDSFEHESEVHLKGKLLLYEWFKKFYTDVQIETYFSSIDQRADISFVHNGEMHAVEFQCSKIPTKLIQKRTEGYINAGIRPLWILSHKQLPMIGNHLFSLTTFHYALLQQTSTNQLMIPFLNVETERVYVLSHLLPITTKKTFALLSINALHSKPLYELLNQGYDRISFSLWLEERNRLKSFGNLQYSSFSRRFKEEIYRRGLSIGGLPDVCGLPVNGAAKFITGPIQWQTYLFLDVINTGQVFYFDDLMESIEHRVNSKDIRIRKGFPVSISDVLSNYLHLLCFLKVVSAIDGVSYKISSPKALRKNISREEGEYTMALALWGRKKYF